jgi:Tfp pilus assembly protein PilN
MKNNIFSMSRLTGQYFESQPRYSFWGARNHFWKMMCKLMALLVISGWLLMLGMQVFRNQQTLQLLASQEQEVRQQIIDLKAKQQKQSQLPASVLTTVQVRGYNSVIRQLNLPWKSLFEDLEAMTPEDVALISIEPDGSRSTVKLVAEAKTLATLLDYTSKLQQNGEFGRLTYSKHETNEQDTNKPVRLSFELELRSLPATANKILTNGQKLKVGQP